MTSLMPMIIIVNKSLSAFQVGSLKYYPEFKELSLKQSIQFQKL